jgi:hypothetical protein
MDNDPNRKWFIWGMVLAWAPVPLIVGGVLHAFPGISEQKATGAVAGGLAEVYVTSGLILTFICLVGGIVLLGRSFSGGHRMRALFSVLSMGWSALMLLIFGLLMWLFFFKLPHGVRGPQ